MSANLKLTPLVVDLLRQGYAVRFRAPGQSMAPTIPNDTVITVEPLAADAPIDVGDVVLARINTRLIAHRVIGVEGQGTAAQFRLRGDAQASVVDCVARRAILGRLLYLQPHFGKHHRANFIRSLSKALPKLFQFTLGRQHDDTE